MKQLVFLYWGCAFLMYLSQVYYPCGSLAGGIEDKAARLRSRYMDIFMVAAIAWMTCFSFLRTSYNDTGTYIIHFQQSESVADFFARGGLLDWTGNPLSELYRDLIRSITENYHIYFFFPAFLSSYAVVKLCKKYSPSPAFSVLIFFSIGTYVMYIAALKQCFAVFFLLLALPYAIDRKYVRFYLLVFVAILFHTHAFMFAVIPLLMDKPWGKVSWILLGLTIFAMLTYNFTLGAFMEYAQSLGANVAEEEVFDDHAINILRVVVYWIPAFLAFVFQRRLFRDSSRTENLFVNMSLLSAFILMIGLVQGANLYARMAAYFEIATVIALPWMIQKLFTKPSAKFVTACAFVFYFVYFLYEFGVSKGFGEGYRAITLWQFIASLFV